MNRPVLLNPSRWPSLARDLAAIALLATVSVLLGLYARGGRPAPAAPEAPSAAATISSGAPATAANLAHPSLTLAEVRAHVDAGTALVLDARPASDYAAGHLPGALSLPAEDFDAAHTRLAERLLAHRDTLVIAYCSNHWCGLSDEIQHRLVRLGHAHVGTFPGGWEAWRSAGLPVETGP